MLNINQNFSFMRQFRESLLNGIKTRTNRAFSEFRNKCGPGYIMHIFIGMRTENCEKLFDSMVQDKITWNIDNAPKTEKEARTTISPLQNENWYDFAIKDGFTEYKDFLDYFSNHPKKSKNFICFIF